MSVTGSGGVGIPVILLHDAEGGFVTVELKNGYSYRGILDEAQDNFNCTIKECTKIDPHGQEIKLEMAFVRGAQIKFIVVPEMLSLAPYFDRIKAWRKYKGNPIVGASGIDSKSQLGKRDRGGPPMGGGQPQYGGRGPGGPYGGPGPGGPPGGGYGRPPPRGYGPPGGGGGYGMPIPPPGQGGMMPMGGGPPGARGPPVSGYGGPPVPRYGPGPPRHMMPGMPPPHMMPRGGPHGPGAPRPPR